MEPMTIIGVTGGSGAGKGEVSHCFLAYGIPALDTDRVSRKVCEKGTECLAELVECFGERILKEDGTLNRHFLAELVFSEPDPQKREHYLNELNTITHKHILVEVERWIKKKEEEGCRAVVIDAPQIFEAGFDKRCDFVVGILADKEVRIRRILARDGITREAAEARIASQHDDSFFAAYCDYLIYNNAGLDELEGQIENLLKHFSLKV